MPFCAILILQNLVFRKNYFSTKLLFFEKLKTFGFPNPKTFDFNPT